MARSVTVGLWVLVGLFAASCDRAPPASAPLVPEPAPPIAEAAPPETAPAHPKPTPTASPVEARTVADYMGRRRAELQTIVRGSCPDLADLVPKASETEDGRDVRIEVAADWIWIATPGEDGFDDEGEAYRWVIDWFWAVDLYTCRDHAAAASLYSTSVYDSTDTHWLVGRPKGAVSMVDPLRVAMLGAEPDPNVASLGTVQLHQSACERGDESARQVRARIPKGRDWEVLPLRRAAQPWHDGPPVTQARAFFEDTLDPEGFDWPGAFRDADLAPWGIAHPHSDAPRREHDLGARSLWSVRMGSETAYAVVDGARHRWIETTHGCLSGTFQWIDFGDDLAIAKVAGLDDAPPAEETWMILGHERSGVLVLDLQSGVSHELVTRRGTRTPLTSADLRARLTELAAGR